MSDNFSETITNLQKAHRRVILWKYGVLIASALVLVTLTGLQFRPFGFSITAVYSNLAASVSAGLLISVIYDTFTRTDNSIMSQIDHQKLSRDLSNRLLGGYGPSILAADQIHSFMANAVSDARCLDALASCISHSPEVRRTIKRSVFDPLWNEPLPLDVEIRNRLSLIPGDNERYRWELRQTFKMSKPHYRYRCIVTGENEIGSALNSMTDKCDTLVLITLGRDKGKSLVEQAHLEMYYEDNLDGQRKKVILNSINVGERAFDDYPHWPKSWKGKIDVIDFPIEDTSNIHKHTLTFRSDLRFSDPYFYWIADRPMIVKTIVIDYPSLVTKLGRVSVVPLFGSHNAALEVQRLNGHLESSLDSILWPGQGLAMIWRGETTDPLLPTHV